MAVAAFESFEALLAGYITLEISKHSVCGDGFRVWHSGPIPENEVKKCYGPTMNCTVRVPEDELGAGALNKLGGLTKCEVDKLVRRIVGRVGADHLPMEGLLHIGPKEHNTESGDVSYNVRIVFKGESASGATIDEDILAGIPQTIQKEIDSFFESIGMPTAVGNFVVHAGGQSASDARIPSKRRFLCTYPVVHKAGGPPSRTTNSDRDMIDVIATDTARRLYRTANMEKLFLVGRVYVNFVECSHDIGMVILVEVYYNKKDKPASGPTGTK